MGIYDRDYSREREPGFHVTAPTTAAVQLVLITAAAYVAQLAIGKPFNEGLALQSDWFRRGERTSFSPMDSCMPPTTSVTSW